MGGGLEPEAWRAWHGGHGMVEPPVGSRAEPLVGGSGGRSRAAISRTLALLNSAGTNFINYLLKVKVRTE